MIVMLLDNHYAPDRRIECEASLLVDAGEEVRVIGWDRRESRDCTNRVGSDGLDVRRIHSEAAHGLGWRSLGALLRFSVEVLRQRRELMAGAQCLVAHDLYVLPLAVCISRMMRIRLVYDAHEDWPAMERERYPRAIREVLSRVETTLAGRASAVVVPGQCRARRWQRVGIEPIVFGNHGSATVPNEQAQGTTDYDITYCGSLLPGRRLDLLLDLAKRRPDLRIAIAGAGRLAEEIRSAAKGAPNIEYRGWDARPDLLFARSRSIYYGLDPRRAYARIACPNTLYMALQVRKPLVFFCEGEPGMLVRHFRIGVQAEPTVGGLETALDSALEEDDWEFEAAWRSIDVEAMNRRYVAAIVGQCG